MQNLMNWLLFILILTVILELLYIILLRKGIENIGRDFSNKLNDDTNTALTVSFPDKGLKKFALLINKELKTLRNEKLKLEQGNMELNKAITNIAHDLRTPLAAIKGYLELLETAADEKKKERYLSVIAERTEALNTLMEELFQYSVVTTSNKSLEMEELSLNSELEIALAGAYGMLSARGINPVIEIPDIAVKRKLSHEALQRIFDNILVNSAKYS
ncbi:MAG: sensor histidine kinase, partial [Erysipelotrichaceae bacterium]